MKNILVIIAHPKRESLTNAMATSYIAEAVKDGSRVETIDLYHSKMQQPFFTYEDANALEVTEEMRFFQAKIEKADELIFFFPFWWGGMPAILKNFIDWNFSKGFAFTYENSRPKGLLKGKSVKVFTTTGAPKLFYMLTGASRRLKNTIKEQIVHFCGMEMKSFYLYGGVDTSGKNAKEILLDVKKRVR